MKRLAPIFLLAGALALALGLPFLFAQPAPFNYPPSSGGGGTDYVTNSGGLATNLQVYSSGTTNQPLRIFGGTQTNSNPLEYSATWDAAGVTFSALNLSVTDTASATYSRLVSATVGGADTFVVTKGAKLYLAETPALGSYALWGDGVNTWVNAPSGGYVQIGIDDGWGVAVHSASFRLSSAYVLGWTGSNPATAMDTGLARNSAGVIEFNNGTAGTYRDARLRTVEMYAQPSDPASSATLAMLFAKTNAGTTECFVMDGAANVTQLSPHARAASPAPAELDAGDPQPIVIHHANLYLGTEEFLHLSALAKEVERLSGKKFLYQRQLDPARKRDWATEETAIEQRHAAERAADLERLAAWQSTTNQNKGPQPPVRPAYQKRPRPAWLNN